MNVLYLGYNSFKKHKRGVENVIDFQAQATEFSRIYYLHWGTETTSYKNGNFRCVSIKNCWYWPLLLNWIFFKIRKKNKLIIHSHNPLFSFFLFFRTHVLTVHDGLYYLSKINNSRVPSLIFALIERSVYYKCVKVHFISQFTKSQSLFGNRKNYVIIPNTSHFESKAPIIIKNTKLPLGKVKILIIRSLEERARFDLLLEVAESLKSCEFEFTVAGKGPLLKYYQGLIAEKQLSNIRMLGYVDDNSLLKLYADCDLVLMVAEYGEGFGLPIIEGYLFNKPVIASNTCAIPEVIISKHYLFENTVESIIEKITQVCDSPNLSYRSYYEKNYSNSIVGEKFRNLISSVYL